ncbi:MAG: diphosphomevalonate decarboxylase [Bacteriovoracaceae bacterium]|nr:diphosphomevalonate decarboxylase [Bacteriovoracaceae bacterium]
MFPKEWLSAKPIESFSTSVSAPANIAFIKYWGKKGPQLPANPSLSLTLSESRTLTEIDFKLQNKLSVELWFEGKRAESFEKKTLDYLISLSQSIPVLGQYHYKIQSQNTFPHSSGIASSASSQAALALCLSQLMARATHTGVDWNVASSLARLGSGSACRSLKGSFVVWGETSRVPGSSDEYGLDVTKLIHSSFHNAKDCILISSSKEKEVSSRAGHGQMKEHPFAQSRFVQARENFSQMWDGLLKGDWEKVGELMEVEALTLHALMMTSNPGYILLEPSSLEIIRLVRLFRKESGVPVYFTIDAGPNIHLIYPESAHAKVEPFVRHELIRFTENGNGVIWDQMGLGAK